MEHPLYYLWYNPKHKIDFFIRNRFLKLPFRLRKGFWPSECWNIDFEIARWLIPRLEHFKEVSHTVPPRNKNDPKYIKDEYETHFLKDDEWKIELQEIIEAFKSVLRNYEPLDMEYKLNCNNKEFQKYKNANLKEYKKAQRGINLFAKRFMSLWD